MNCTDCQNQFSDFIDDEISLKMARTVESHLAGCPACAAELQLFKQTVHTLHTFPTAKVPADFLIGINEKLSPQPFAKLKALFSFLADNKLTATATLATVMIGVISAAVLQLSPLDQTSTLAQKDSGETLTMQAMAVDPDQTNYYPGIPYLAKKAATSQGPIAATRVKFSPVKQSSPNSGHNSLFTSRGPPSLVQPSSPHPSLSRFGAIPPDLVVTVHASSTAYQHALIRQMTANHNWRTQISGNTLLVSLPGRELANFQHIFGPVDPHITPSELSHLNKLSSASRLTVAVAFH